MQRLVASRSARVGLLVAMAGGWLGIIVGVLGDLPALVAAAAVVTGASNVALVKLHLETRSAVAQLAVSTRIDRGRSADQLRSLENRRTVLEERSGAFEERIVQLEERGGELEVARARIDEHIARLEREASARAQRHQRGGRIARAAPIGKRWRASAPIWRSSATRSR